MGDAAADVSSLARGVSRLSVLAADLGDLLDALDVNPVIVSAEGCVAVDALVIRAARGGRFPDPALRKRSRLTHAITARHTDHSPSSSAERGHEAVDPRDPALR